MPPELKLDPEIAKLIEKAKAHVITEEEAHKQRVSYIVGNMPTKSKATTGDVEQAIKTQHKG